MATDSFADGLLRRVESYRQAEEAADRRLEEIMEERDRLRHRRQAAEMLYEAEFGQAPPPSTGLLTESEPNQAELVPPVSGPFTGRPWAGSIEQVLREADRPLHVKDIWARLAAGGFRTEARDPLRSIVAISVRSPRIAKAAPNTYAVVQESLDDGREHHEAPSRATSTTTRQED